MDIFELSDRLENPHSSSGLTDDVNFIRDVDTGYSSNNSSIACSPDSILLNGASIVSSASLEISSKRNTEINFTTSVNSLPDFERKNGANLNTELINGFFNNEHITTHACHRKLVETTSIPSTHSYKQNNFTENCGTRQKYPTHVDMSCNSIDKNFKTHNMQQKSPLIYCDPKVNDRISWSNSPTSSHFNDRPSEKFDFDKLVFEHNTFNVHSELSMQDNFNTQTSLRNDLLDKSKCLFDDNESFDSSVMLLSPESCKGSEATCELSLTTNDQSCLHNSERISSDPQDNANVPIPPPKPIDIPDIQDFSESSSMGESPHVRTPGSMTSNLAGQMNPRFITEDEVWRSYLENPLTAATTAMMSIHGDEDSTAALGLLYDYYKVPREKRILSYQLECMDPTSRHTIAANQDVAIGNASFTSNSLLHGNVAVQRARGHSGSSSIDQDSILNDVLSVRSDCNSTMSLNRPDLQLSTEVSTDFLNIDKPNCSDELKTRPLTLDNGYPETNSSSPQVLSFGDYSNSHFTMRGRIRDIRNKRKNAFLTNGTNQHEEEQLQMHLNVPQQHVVPPSAIGIPTLFDSRHESYLPDQNCDLFEYNMEAPKSLKQKDGEPTMSYINKGQFYCISLRQNYSMQSCPGNGRVTSVVQIVFGDSKPEEEQLRHWKYWHARQHTAKQRIIDIADYKESCMINDIEEFAHNAISFSWDPNDVAKIFISCNCLSTDFSAQKGIKGLPLLLQIDTYIESRRRGTPDHRGSCQLKVFCDKGAERKIRDEERKAMRKKHKGPNKSQQHMPLSPVDIKPILHSPSVTPPPQTVSCQNTPIQKKLDIVPFMTTADRRPAIYFIPEVYGTSRNHSTISPTSRMQNETTFINGAMTPTSGSEVDHGFLSNQLDCFDPVRSPNKRRQSLISSEEGDFPPTKLPRMWESDSNKKVLLYIRKEDDDVFDALMLKEATLDGLREALYEKFNIPDGKISKLLKKSKKGVLVNMDDNIIRHYSNEDTFVIDITQESCGDDSAYKVTLSAV